MWRWEEPGGEARRFEDGGEGIAVERGVGVGVGEESGG